MSEPKKNESSLYPELLLELAFWQSYVEDDHEPMTVDALIRLRNEMVPLVTDAVAYYMRHNKAPLLEEIDEED